MLKMVEDESIESPTLGKVYERLWDMHEHWMSSDTIHDTQIKASVRETGQCKDRILATLEAFKNETSADETAVATQVREYIAWQCSHPCNLPLGQAALFFRSKGLAAFKPPLWGKRTTDA